MLAALLLALAAAQALASPPLARPSPPPPTPPPVCAWDKRYSALLNASCTRVAAAAPAFPPADQASFMQAYAAFNGTGSEAAVTQAAKALLADAGVQAFLGLPDSFSAGGLDADMVLCAVLTDATPLGLAEFAVQGPSEEAIVGGLLNDTLLMRDMLVAGGPVGGQYGPAAAIYAAINQSSGGASPLPPPPPAPPGALWDDRNQSTVLRRLALGVALGHAVPIPTAYAVNATIDPLGRYLHYQSAYLAGALDPAFEVLSAFECSLVADSNGLDEDQQWLRTTMANFRPDYIAREWQWRYIQAVHQEVAYGDSACDTFMPGVCTAHYSQIPVGGGVCGPRAFFSRFARKSFGLPTWGVTEHGHAAMSSWSPAEGWTTQLGAGWQYGWWGPRSGVDFFLEVQAREGRAGFQGVLRGGWVARARGEPPVSSDWVPSNPKAYGQGGVWGALMLYAKKIAVAAALPLPPRAVGPSVVPTSVAALLAAWPAKWPKPNITTDASGTIVVPSAAYEAVNRSAAVAAMKSFDLLGQQLVVVAGNYLDPAASSVTYVVPVPTAGPRYLTANFSTWHINIDLLLQVNGNSSQLLPVPVYYTFGYWNQTQPVEVQLAAGNNVLTFMRSSEATAPLAIKEFFLYATRPDFPAPIANYTPAPPAPRPDRFIEVPQDTTCAKQGISDVPEDFCLQACEALDFKYAGGRPSVNMTGCFVLTPPGGTGGSCSYNTNQSAAVCPEQPCTIGGSVARQVCLRQ